jgi:hypothetical protein
MIRKLHGSILVMTEKFYQDKSEIAKIYYTRMFKQLHDDIIEYIGIMNNVDEVRTIISSALDIFEEKLHGIINSRILERKGEISNEDEVN